MKDIMKDSIKQIKVLALLPVFPADYPERTSRLG